MPHDSETTSARVSIRARGEVLIASPDYFSYPLWEKQHKLEIGAMHSNLQVVNLKIHPESDFDSLFELAGNCRNLLGVILNAGLPTPKPVLRRLDELGLPVVIIGELDRIRKGDFPEWLLKAVSRK